jgi:ATP-dependent DNA ligase
LYRPVASRYLVRMALRLALMDTSPLAFPSVPRRRLKAGWVHEIKHDGYRLIVRRDGPAVRLFTRRGYD